MNPNVALIIISVFVALLVMVFCVSFSASLAKLKSRSKAWGFLGFLLGPVGLIIVCYLPSKRGDNLQTNPIKHMLLKIPGVSRKTIGMLIALAVAVVVTVVLYDLIPVWLENYKYQSEITSQNINTLQPKLIHENITKVYASGESTFALTADGKVYCFGKQFVPSLDDTSVIYNDAKKVMSSENTLFILDNNGTLFKSVQTENENKETVTELVKLTDNVVDFSVSEATIGIIKTDKKLYMMGVGSHGQMGTYNELSKDSPVPVLGSVTQVVCEANFTLALQKSGDAVAFGSNYDGQFGKTEKTFNYPVAIHSNIKQIAAGDDFILLLDESGNLFSCGKNDCGQLGNATNENSATFIQVMTDVTQIDAAKKSAFALNSKGELFAWGQNTVGQLGNKNTNDQNLPVKVGENVIDFDTSGLHTVIITSDGKTHSTGFNNCGQLGRGDARDDFSQLVTVKTK